MIVRDKFKTNWREKLLSKYNARMLKFQHLAETNDTFKKAYTAYINSVLRCKSMVKDICFREFFVTGGQQKPKQ